MVKQTFFTKGSFYHFFYDLLSLEVYLNLFMLWQRLTRTHLFFGKKEKEKNRNAKAMPQFLALLSSHSPSKKNTIAGDWVRTRGGGAFHATGNFESNYDI